MTLFDAVRENPYILAPLAGYTDYPFRKLSREYGASLVYTEMVSIHSMTRRGLDRIKHLLYFDKSEHPIGIQLFGNDPARFHDAAAIAESLGFDLVDINFGCPVQKVIKANAGAFHHKDLKSVEETIKAAVSAVKKIPVSIKMRSGWCADTVNFMEMARIAEDNGVSIITLHPRTRSQMFTGKSDWSHIKELKEKSKLFIIGNGDINTRQDALRMKTETGCDAMMIGRAAIGHPFIFREIAEEGWHPDRSERVKAALRHLELLHEFKGGRGIMEMRKYYGRYFKGFEGIGEIKKELVALEDYGEVVKMISGIEG